MWLQGGKGGKDWDIGISRCKLLFVGWINNKVLCVAQGTIDPEQRGSKGQDLSALPSHREDAHRSAFHPLLAQQGRPSHASLRD